ncbi:DNA-directed DNA polymerase [Salix suchowensis]|nr:DNA-directed DNA polymerase [Salix suchowensis]
MTAKGAELLLAATVVQQYCADTPDFDTLSVSYDFLKFLTVLIRCVPQTCIEGITKMFPEKKKKLKKDKVETTDPEPIDILVDVIIGFMERSTNYLRTVGSQYDRRSDPHSKWLSDNGARYITPTAPATRTPRPSPVDDEDDEEDEDEEEDEEDEGVDGEYQQKRTSRKKRTGMGRGRREDLETRRKIEDALRANGLADDEDDDDDLMDDDQMMAVDEQLAEIFRSRANEKHGKDLVAGCGSDEQQLPTRHEGSFNLASARQGVAAGAEREEHQQCPQRTSHSRQEASLLKSSRSPQPVQPLCVENTDYCRFRSIRSQGIQGLIDRLHDAKGICFQPGLLPRFHTTLPFFGLEAWRRSARPIFKICQRISTVSSLSSGPCDGISTPQARKHLIYRSPG